MDEQHPVENVESRESSRTGGAAMRARRWAIAASREPAAYGIPELPGWRRLDDGDGFALAQAGSTEPFITAQQPMTVRR